eukprot:183057-Chlamydomonas_euryale.AAC.2
MAYQPAAAAMNSPRRVSSSMGTRAPLTYTNERSPVALSNCMPHMPGRRRASPLKLATTPDAYLNAVRTGGRAGNASGRADWSIGVAPSGSASENWLAMAV